MNLPGKKNKEINNISNPCPDVFSFFFQANLILVLFPADRQQVPSMKTRGE